MSAGSLSDYDLYRFGLWLGWRTVPVWPAEGVRRLIYPIEYVRCAEMRYVLKQSSFRADLQVLDIGSPKLLSVCLAARVGATVHATDLIDYFVPAYRAYIRAIGDAALAERLVMETQDAQHLTYPEHSFDRVFSISTIEHIPGDGDGLAIKEIERVLRPGGIACLTMPWSDRGYREVYKRKGDPDAYWTDGDGDEVFYQRAYDRTSIERRLLSASGLKLVDMSFVGEKRAPVESIILSRRLPKLTRYLLLPFHFPLARLFLSGLAEGEFSYKKVVCLTFIKPGGVGT